MVVITLILLPIFFLICILFLFTAYMYCTLYCKCISKKGQNLPLPPHQLCSFIWHALLLYQPCTYPAVCCSLCFRLMVSTTSLVWRDFPVPSPFLNPSIASSLITFDPWLILSFSSELTEWNWNEWGYGSSERSELRPGVQWCLELGPGRWSWSYYTT